MDTSTVINETDENTSLVLNQKNSSENKNCNSSSQHSQTRSVIAIFLSLSIFGIFLAFGIIFASNFMFTTQDFVRRATGSEQYASFTLSNSMKVLLVHDPDTSKSAAALSVNIGSFSDPEDLPGLAHLCEHMVFLYNKKYPKINTFQEFVSQNGGSSNAFTSDEQTNFYFEISNFAFLEGLDMFAQMFIDPIFDQTGFEKELPAVQSEYDMDLENADYQFQFLLKGTCDVESPFAKFTIGSTQTLKDIPQTKKIDTLQELQKYFDKYFHSGLMTFSLISNRTLDDSKDQILSVLTQIKEKKVSEPTNSQQQPPTPFGKDELKQRLIQYKPINEIHKLSLVFQTESSKNYLQDNPYAYFMYIFDNIGKGSLRQILIDMNMILDFRFSIIEESSRFDLYTLEFALTDSGFNQVEEVIKIAVAYIDFVAKKGISEDIFHQVKKTKDTVFLYTQNDQIQLLTLASSYVDNLDLFPTKYAVSGDQLIYMYRPNILNRFIEYFSLEHMNIYLGSPRFKVPNSADSGGQGNAIFELQQLSAALGDVAAAADEKDEGENNTTAGQKSQQKNLLKQPTVNMENLFQDLQRLIDQNEREKSTLPKFKYSDLTEYIESYNIHYVESKIPSDLLEVLKQTSSSQYDPGFFQLPKPNPYLPSKPELVMACQNKKMLCSEDYRQDTSNFPKQIINSPKMTTYYALDRSFRVPQIYFQGTFQSNQVLREIKKQVCVNILRECIGQAYQYEIDLAQKAGNKISMTSDSISILAFNEKFDEIAKLVLEAYGQSQFNGTIFEKGYFLADQTFTSLRAKSQFQRSYIILEYLLYEYYNLPETLQDAMKNYTYTDFKADLYEVRAKRKGKSLIMGNLLEPFAKQLSNEVVQFVQYRAINETVENRVADIQGQNLVWRENWLIEESLEYSTFNYYQVGEMTLDSLSMIYLIEHMMSMAAYTKLRTEKNLGYVIDCRQLSIGNSVGIEIFVLGTGNEPLEVDKEIEAFMKEFVGNLEGLTDVEWNDLKASLEDTLKFPQSTLQERGDMYFEQIRDGSLAFDMKQRVRERIAEISKKDVVEFYKKILERNSKISIQIYPSSTKIIPMEVLGVKDTSAKVNEKIIKTKEELGDIKRFPEVSTI